MVRPQHLPDFSDPPLDEVVLGVQFAPIPNYSSVCAHDVWSLFSDDFPKVLEQPVLEPSFEAFGGANPQPSFQFQVGPPPAGSRLWFLTDDENHLLQFQSDRFLTNWRKRPQPQDYPRFEGIAAAFRENFVALNSYTNDKFQYEIDVNQAEVSYVNIIPVDDFSDASRWFKLWDGGSIAIDALNAAFDEVMKDSNGRPYARLKHHIQSVFAADGTHKAFRLSLTFRGKPTEEGIDGSMKFLEIGRERIVTRFGEITTAEAQTMWGRVE